MQEYCQSGIALSDNLHLSVRLSEGLVGGVHDGVDQQALRIDENVPLLALDLLSRVVTRRINRRPPFSTLFTLWLSITATVGLASLEAASRHFM